MEYKFIVKKSRRKTIGLEIMPDGTILVKAPYGVNNNDINKVLDAHRLWIERHLKNVEERNREASELPPLTAYDIRQLADRAVKYIPERVAYYAPLVGVSYGQITIRNQRTRWGSCSSKGNLNFNCLLMLTPPEVIDSVVVHELCHRKEMNHSSRFYKEVLRVFPEYDKWDKWLKKNGPVLMRRMAGVNG